MKRCVVTHRSARVTANPHNSGPGSPNSGTSLYLGWHSHLGSKNLPGSSPHISDSYFADWAYAGMYDTCTPQLLPPLTITHFVFAVHPGSMQRDGHRILLPMTMYYQDDEPSFGCLMCRNPIFKARPFTHTYLYRRSCLYACMHAWMHVCLLAYLLACRYTYIIDTRV